MFRSALTAHYNTIRTFASHSVEAPRTKIGLGNLADNAGAVSEVSLQASKSD
jgi:large subunit ribosomal protein L15